MICPSAECGNTDNPENSKFCILCGTPMLIKCTQCSTSLPPIANFCANCGVKIVKPDGKKTTKNTELVEITTKKKTTAEDVKVKVNILFTSRMQPLTVESGGGWRVVNLSKDDDFNVIFNKISSLYFKDGNTKLGQKSSYVLQLLDFKKEPIARQKFTNLETYMTSNGLTVSKSLFFLQLIRIFQPKVVSKNTQVYISGVLSNVSSSSSSSSSDDENVKEKNKNTNKSICLKKPQDSVISTTTSSPVKRTSNSDINLLKTNIITSNKKQRTETSPSSSSSSSSSSDNNASSLRTTSKNQSIEKKVAEAVQKSVNNININSKLPIVNTQSANNNFNKTVTGDSTNNTQYRKHFNNEYDNRNRNYNSNFNNRNSYDNRCPQSSNRGSYYTNYSDRGFRQNQSYQHYHDEYMRSYRNSDYYRHDRNYTSYNNEEKNQQNKELKSVGSVNDTNKIANVNIKLEKDV